MDNQPTKELVEAWLYAVLHPLIEGLEQELYFLESQENPTWRFRPQRCEFIRHVHEFVGREQHANLEQFLRFNKSFHELFVAHDDDLKRLLSAAIETYSALLQLPELKELTGRIDKEHKDWRGAYPEGDGPSLLAENIINFSKLSKLPNHYSNAKAWEHYGPEALKLRTDVRISEKAGRLDEARARLTGSVKKLVEELRGLRDQLADKHGLPAVRTETGDSLEFF